MVRFSRTGKAMEEKLPRPAGCDVRAGRAQPWPMAYPSALVTVTHTSVSGLAAAAAASCRARAGSRRPKPWISPGRSASPSSVVSGTIRSAGRRWEPAPSGERQAAGRTRRSRGHWDRGDPELGPPEPAGTGTDLGSRARIAGRACRVGAVIVWAVIVGVAAAVGFIVIAVRFAVEVQVVVVDQAAAVAVGARAVVGVALDVVSSLAKMRRFRGNGAWPDGVGFVWARFGLGPPVAVAAISSAVAVGFGSSRAGVGPGSVSGSRAAGCWRRRVPGPVPSTRRRPRRRLAVRRPRSAQRPVGR